MEGLEPSNAWTKTTCLTNLATSLHILYGNMYYIKIKKTCEEQIRLSSILSLMQLFLLRLFP